MSKRKIESYIKGAADAALNTTRRNQDAVEREGINKDTRERRNLSMQIKHLMEEKNIYSLDEAIEIFINTDDFQKNFGYLIKNLTHKQLVENLKHRYNREIGPRLNKAGECR